MESPLTEVTVELAEAAGIELATLDVLATLADHCTKLFGVAAGVMVPDRDGLLHTVAVSGDAPTRETLTRLFDQQAEEGPCRDAFCTRQPVAADDLDSHADVWPRFAASASHAGIKAVRAFPLTYQQVPLGVACLLSTQASALTADGERRLQPLLELATVGLLQQSAAARAHKIVGQLQGALNSRIVIEQAKGMLAQRSGLGVDQAFTALRNYARSNRLRLADLAKRVVDGTGDPTVILDTLPLTAARQTPVSRPVRRPRPGRAPLPPGQIRTTRPPAMRPRGTGPEH
ncbi:MAG TPA: GAF and ANTAR domain-containing protein [Actinopolymorphaceae bacterium]|jgi:GAF domain-containing protein